MLTEEKLHELKTQLQVHLPLLGKTAEAITDQDISNYPVFVAHQAGEEFGLGLPVIATHDDLPWSINVSTLEELASKQIVAMEKVESFTALYKTHPNDLCLLVWNDGAAQFVFLPRRMIAL